MPYSRYALARFLTAVSKRIKRTGWFVDKTLGFVKISTEVNRIFLVVLKIYLDLCFLEFCFNDIGLWPPLICSYDCCAACSLLVLQKAN